MKKRLAYIIAVISVICSGILLFACSEEKEQTYTVLYTATEGGYICMGETYWGDYRYGLWLTVESGDAVAGVTAEPNEGYEFVKWSDGVTTPERRDVDIRSNLHATAEFARIQREYKLNYRLDSESELFKPSVIFKYGSLDGVKLPVLQKENFTFCGWYYDGEQIADEHGNLLIDDDFVKQPIKKDSAGIDKVDVIAKWTAKESFEFKILVIYVTKIKADLEDKHFNMHHIDFEMSDLQRQVCHKNTQMLKREMDAMTDGLVDFKIDEYFTTQTVYTESFKQGRDNPDSTFLITSLYPSYIPEVREANMLDGYDATVSAFGFFGDRPTSYEAHMFNYPVGTATELKGECEVFLDPIFSRFGHGGDISLEDVLDGKLDDYWYSYIETYVHEIAHTIELRLNCFDFDLAGKIWINYIYNDLV